MFLWYDEENDNFEELETTLNKTKSYVSVTAGHFSKYMIVDKTEWFEAWSRDLYADIVENVPYGLQSMLVIDCSGSMYSNDPNEAGRKAAATGYINLARDNDYIGILAEDSQPQVICNFTSVSEKSSLLSALSKLYSSGGNNFNASITKSVEMFEAEVHSPEKLIVFMSDGGDYINDSVLDKAKNAEIKIITIGFGNWADESILKHIAEYTDGEYYKAVTESDLINIYESISYGNRYNFENLPDTDGDGIPDDVEISGLRYSNGKIVFTDPNNPDTDGDGLLDGEEIEVRLCVRNTSLSNTPEQARIYKYYFNVHSDPTKVDSDGDGFCDADDFYPLEKPTNYSEFAIIDSFNHMPEEALLEDVKKQSDESYNTYKSIGVEFTYAQANLIALAGNASFFANTAGDMLFHYLENTGDTYNLDVKSMIYTSEVSKKRYEELIKKAKEYSVDVLQEGNSVIIMSERVNAHEYNSVIDVNWNASVGQCSGILICEAKKIDCKITLKSRYIVYDFYDWQKGSDNTFIPTVSDGDMYTLHESGYAKQFYVYGEYINETT